MFDQGPSGIDFSGPVNTLPSPEYFFVPYLMNCSVFFHPSSHEWENAAEGQQFFFFFLHKHTSDEY